MVQQYVYIMTFMNIDTHRISILYYLAASGGELTQREINGIENFWSFTKRRLNKFNGTKVNFPLHLKECEWRYDNPVVKMEKELIKLLKNSDSLLKIKDFLV